MTTSHTQETLHDNDIGPIGSAAFASLGSPADRIAEVAARTPLAYALREGSQRLTFEALDARVGRLAQRLAAAGVRPETRVGILLERSADHVVAVLAALRAGTTAILLDPAGPPERIIAKLAGGNAEAVVTHSGLAGMLPAELPGTVLLTDLDTQENDVVAPVPPAEGTGLLIYGAGSTGVAAATLSNATALDALVTGIVDAYGLTDANRGAWLSPPGGAFGLAEWLPFLAAGAEVVIADAATASSPVRLRDWLLATRATHVGLDVERAERICALPWPGGAPVRVLTVHGGRLRVTPPPGLPFAIVNGYGSAETTGLVLLTRVATGTRDAGPRLGPLAGTRLHVLDENLRPVPAGVVGELYAAGPTVTVAYPGEPARTAAAFVRHGLADEPASLLYRTGDVARLGPAGTIEVLGRIGDLPIVDGFIVDPHAVEAEALRHPGVREAVVLTATHPPRFTCYAVPRGADDRFAADLRDVLAEHLAAGTEVSVVVVSGALPRLADGRPDRQALLAATPASREPREPGTGLPVIVARPEDRHLPFPLTDTQQAYWIGRSDAVEFGNVGCHGYWEWESVGLDVGRFRQAWAAVLARHEMLRAIVLPDGTQKILADLPEYEIPVLDLRAERPEVAEARAEQLRAELSHQVLPADQWPLWDVRITLLPGERVRLHLGLDLLIIDAWSYFHVLIPDLVNCYESGAPTAEPLTLTFRDYVLATSGASLEAAEHYRRSQAYWLDRLNKGLPSAPDLPRAPAAAAGTGRFTRRQHQLPAEAWSQLQVRGKASSLTPSVIVVAAFAEVLRTWSRNDQFTINFPLFNRLPLDPRVDELIGDFTTTSLLAVEKTDGTFVERAASIQEQLWTDLEHRHFGGVRVMRELARRSDGAVRAAFPVVVTSLLGQPPRHFTTALGKAVHTSTQTPQVTLDFQVSEVEGRLEFSWDTLDEVFPPGMLADMFAAYCGLLERLAADPSAWAVESFDLVPAAQLALREQVNSTSVEWPDHLLHAPVARHAAARPEALAVVSSGRRLSYAELDRRVNQVGRALREAGARPNQLVAIVMERGWEQIVAAHGVLASGAAYLPIDPTAPAGRLAALLEDGQVELVLTQSGLDGRLEWPSGPRRLLVDRDFEEADATALPSVQTPTDLAYVIYTSGSTGQPKGVMVDHRGAANTILDINGRYGVGADDSCLAVSGLHFDLSVYDVFGMIEAGGTVVLPDPYDIPDPAAWAQLVQREGVTFWNSVPALIEVLAGHLEGLRAAGADVDDTLKTLRLTVLAGDWIPVTLPDRLRALAPNLQVIGSGGPTETCVWSVIYPIGAVDPGWASIPYGKPMSNQRYHVLDDRLRPRPTWVPGQIHIGSPVGLAHGYWRDPERTSAKFFDLPGTSERAYASGDMGRYLPDGNIEILGREDFQVKIQGYRIELGEVEAALADHPAVDRAVVVAAGPARHSRRLAGYLTAMPGESVDPAEVQKYAAGVLPAYMIPATVVVLDFLPLTGNGKVDRLALAAMAAEVGGGRTGEFAEPTTALEQVVAWIWQDLLEIPQVGLADHFFQLGGDSITATALVGRVRELFGVELALKTIFAEPTLGQICHALATDPERGEHASAMAEALVGLTDEDMTSLAEETD